MDPSIASHIADEPSPEGVASSTPEEERQRKKFAMIERGMLDGTARQLARNRGVEISDDHWAFWIRIHLNRADSTGRVYAGHKVAAVMGFPFDRHGASNKTNFAKTEMLYEPFVKAGLARRVDDKQFGAGTCPQYLINAVPSFDEASPQPFTDSLRKEKVLPFVLIPAALLEGPWNALSNDQRLCLCSLYAFLDPKKRMSDPNHLRIENGRLVASDAFVRASNRLPDVAMHTFEQLRRIGLVNFTKVGLRHVEVYPGSRPRLIVCKEDGPIEAYLIEPTYSIEG